MHRALLAYKGYVYSYDIDREDDNIKIYHLAIPINEDLEIMLDACPYTKMTQDVFNKLVDSLKK